MAVVFILTHTARAGSHRTDALGHSWEYAYDALGRQTLHVVRAVSGEILQMETYEYDAVGNRVLERRLWTSATGSLWLVTSNRYDNENRLVAITHPDGSVTRTEYNAIGKEAARIDALGRVTSNEYDARGNLVATHYPDGTTETQMYDAENRKVVSVDRMGRMTQFVYDPLGRLVHTIHPDGAMESSVYDALGRVVASIDPLGHVTRYEYEACSCPGRQATVIDALGHETHYEYDENGNRIAMLDANEHETHFVYDALNRQVAVMFSDGTTKTTTYDALGRRVAETDQAGLTTQYRYDALGRLTNVVDALNQVTSYSYDEAGNLIRQTDANGHTTTFEYDSMGRRVKRTLPEGQIERYAYDAAGNITNKVDFNGKVTTYEYDAMNRLVAKIPDASFGASNIVFTYSASSQRLSMSDQSGVTIYEYDARDRLVRKTTPSGSLFYQYDRRGNLLAIQSGPSEAVRVTYTYDELNRLNTVLDPHAGLTMYNYDAVGNLRAFILPNGVSQVYDYDALNRLTNVVVNRLTTPIESYAYTLGPSGHRLAVQEGNGRRVTYQYDNLYRLTSETISGTIVAGRIAYTYDAVGNRLVRHSTVTNILEKLYSYDMNDRLGSDQYDANGNTVAATIHDSLAGTDTAFTYAYDFENRIVAATSAVKVIRIRYDGDGNRVEKVVTDAFGTRTTRYLVDERNPTGYSQVLAEFDSSNNVLVAYTVGLDVISQTQVMPTNDVTHFYGYDGHGSVRFLTDAADGGTGTGGYITDRWDYDAFGNIVAHSGSTANNLLYCGEQFDPDLGLYFLRARFMDTDRGRFWTMDEFDGVLHDPASLHKYLYVGSNPVSWRDPLGKFKLAEINIGMAVVGAMTGTISSLATTRLLNPNADLSDYVINAVIGAAAGFAGGAFAAPKTVASSVAYIASYNGARRKGCDKHQSFGIGVVAAATTTGLTYLGETLAIMIFENAAGSYPIWEHLIWPAAVSTGAGVGAGAAVVGAYQFCKHIIPRKDIQRFLDETW